MYGCMDVCEANGEPASSWLFECCLICMIMNRIVVEPSGATESSVRIPSVICGEGAYNTDVPRSRRTETSIEEEEMRESKRVRG